jgi:hypothetical protein
MPRTIQCTHCGVVLNLPEGAEGRRLKCPKCGEKFKAESAGGQAKPNPASPEADASPSSTLLLTRKPSSADLPSLPASPGDLRETFDLPMMTEAAGTGAKAKSAAAPAADALALFEDSNQPRRKKTSAEGRAQSRRCPTCGGVVPQGMSICQTCGLDLESGTRVDLSEDIAPPPPQHESMPIALSVVGGLCLATGAALTVFSIIKWQTGMDGAIYFIPLALFGVWSAVQFLRGKTAKLLLVALALGAAVDLAFLVAAPIYKAYAEEAAMNGSVNPDDPDAGEVIIKPLAERLDTGTVFKGLGLLGLYAVVSVYLMSPQVRRHMRH